MSKGYCHIWFITRLFFQIFSGTFYWAREAEEQNSWGRVSPFHSELTVNALLSKAISHGHVTQDESEKRAASTKQHRVLM